MSKIEDVTFEVGTFKELVLTTLQKSKEPISLDELIGICSKKIIGVTRESTIQTINSLIEDGYDIKNITQGLDKLVALVRSKSLSEEEMYRVHGKLNTPCILSSDYHLGSKGFYKIAFKQMLNDIEEYSIKDVTIAGDLLQGRGVYSTEFSELQIPDLTGQIDLAVELLSQIDSNIHLVAGNHEEKIQGSLYVGLDALKIVSTACDNIRYYGHVANLMLNDKYRFTMMHGSGSVTMASTQMVEKIWRELIMKPNILQMGHNHQLDYVRKEQDKLCLNSGTLQRTGTWLLEKGHTAKLGWWIIEEMDDDTIKLIDRHPKLM